jgi:hypothetical protein
MPVRRHRPRVPAVEAAPRYRAGKVAAVLGVVVAVVGLELLLFGDDLRRNLDLLLTHQSAARAAGPRPPAPLPVIAPPAAGAITQVELRPLDTCRPEAACTVLLQVGLRPQSEPVPVAWRFEIIDRCGTTRERRDGGPVPVPAGQDRMVQTLPLQLPAGQALAVIPLVTDPARAAGRPMKLPRAGDNC